MIHPNKPPEISCPWWGVSDSEKLRSFYGNTPIWSFLKWELSTLLQHPHQGSPSGSISVFINASSPGSTLSQAALLCQCASLFFWVFGLITPSISRGPVCAGECTSSEVSQVKYFLVS